ncbi:uncharacterized protein LOC143909692 [Arctopsyche grandis]|uniref:uncharacterized protein LOC143909692 n=1 Tax=Arctopsyche grandis TaxID=121162 RepID=UPI00406D708B
MTSKTYSMLFVFLFVTGNVHTKSDKKMALTWKEIVSCPNFENKYIDISRVNIYMANETTVQLKGNIEINIDLNKPIQLKAVVEKYIGSGKYMTMLSYNVELCEKLNGSDDDWSVYINSLRPIPTACPLIKNKYDVSNIQPQTTNFELKRDMIGTYKSTINMYRIEKSPTGIPGAKTIWACLQLNFDVDDAE